MNNLHKLRTSSLLKWVSSYSVNSCCKILFWPSGSSFNMANNPRFYRRKRVVETENGGNLNDNYVDDGQRTGQFSNAAKKQAQAALLEYLHSTRGLQFLDAEHMSKNSPNFLEKLLQKVGSEADIGWAISRFLRYHPINEFEPFFESLGLKPYEYIPFLPRDLMFLSDHVLLLENYYVLCRYGIPRNKIGKIYKEATEVFQFNYGVLELNLQGYEQLGLSQTFVGKVVACSPYLLTGDVNIDFMNVLEMLRKGGIECSWVEEHLLESSYNWSQILVLLNLFSKAGYSNEQLGGLISQHPGILFEGSGGKTLSLIGFLVKLGSSVNQICSMFLHFPHMQLGKFVLNLRQCFLFLTEIEMEVNEIGKIVRSHSLLLGSCKLKKTNTLLANLNIGKKRLCKIIQENPEEIKKWVIGSKIEPLPNSGEDLRSKMLKTKFLLDIGLIENSSEMLNALKVFRGRGTELQERFDCIMKAGLDRKDVCEMIRVSPQILNQKKEVIKNKIDFLLSDLGYPISDLANFPSYLNYTTERVKLRMTMYNWLKEQGTVSSLLALSTVVASTENLFVRQYVLHHPRGLQVWEDLKNKICSK